MKITIQGNPKEIAALISEVKGQQASKRREHRVTDETARSPSYLRIEPGLTLQLTKEEQRLLHESLKQ